MFKAIGKLFKTIGYVLTGRLNQISEVWGQNPMVIKERYEKVITDKQKTFTQYKSAVAKIAAEKKNKESKLKSTDEKIKTSEQMKNGCMQMIKKLVAQLQAEGLDQAAIEANTEYSDLSGSFSDIKSTLAEQLEMKTELERDIENFGEQVDQNLLSMKQINKDIDKLKDEANAAVASVASSKVQREIADSLTNISSSDNSEELAALRNTVNVVKSETELSKEISGMSGESNKQQFLQAAKGVNDDELNSLFASPATESETASSSLEQQVPTE
jgi:phage shock protein A